MAARKKRSPTRAAARAAKLEASAKKRRAQARRKAAPKRAKAKRAAQPRAAGKRGAGKRTARTARPVAAKRRAAPATTKPRAGAPVAPADSLAAEPRSAVPSAPTAARGYTACLAVLASEPIRAGVVRHFFPRARAARVTLEAPLATGDRIHVRGATSDFLASVASLRAGGAPVARAEGGEVTLALPERARPGDVVYALRMPA
jgi:hypothetical protein